MTRDILLGPYLKNKERVDLYALLVLYWLVLLNARLGSLRFAHEFYDALFLLTVFAAPFFRMEGMGGPRLIDRLPKTPSMAYMRACLWLVALFGLPVMTMRLYNSIAPPQMQLSFSKNVRVFAINGVSHRVVYQNTGALDDGTVYVIQERPLGLFRTSSVVFTSEFYNDVETKPQSDSGFWVRGKGAKKRWRYVDIQTISPFGFQQAGR